MNKKARSIIISVFCLALSFIITVQVKSVHFNSLQSKTNPDILRMDELQTALTTEKERNGNLELLIDEYRKQINELRYQNDNPDDALRTMRDSLEKAEMAAGLAEVEGPGVVVTIDDMYKAPLIADPDSTDEAIIHDVNILQVLNEIKDAGAEAISLNGERILATTEVRCAGNVISVNNNRTSSPFIIKAIGDPEKLSAGLNMKNGIVDQLTSWGIKIKVDKQKSITVKAYNGTVNFKYAESTLKGGN